MTYSSSLHMFGFNMTNRVATNTFDKEKIRQIMIQKIDQAEQLVNEIKELAKKIDPLPDKRR